MKISTSAINIRITLTDRKMVDGIIKQESKSFFFSDKKEAMIFWYDENTKHYMAEKQDMDITTSIFTNEELRGY
jgi:hypothetical protein